MLHLKLGFFPPNNSQDDIIKARKILAKNGHPYAKLDCPILYRGDTRAPDIIFKSGFYRKMENNKFPEPYITNKHASYHCIACTKDLVYAVGFADNPVSTHGFFSRENKEEFGWVYMLYTDEGIDLTKHSHGDEENVALLVNEVTVTDVPPENIIAAFQIKTTKNTIKDYYNKNPEPLTLKELSWKIYREIAWQVSITDFKLNAGCTIDPKLYQNQLNDFAKCYVQKYFYIPWSPYPEEKDFQLIHDLPKLQREVYHLGLFVEEAKKIKCYNQYQGLQIGFSINDVTASWFSREHITNAKKGVPIETLRKMTWVEAFGITKQLSYEQVKGLQRFTQVEGLLAGFTKEDVLADWFSRRILETAKNGVPIDTLRPQQSSSFTVSR